MVLSQKSGMRPDVYDNTVDRPFRPNPFRTGILVRNDRPEYGASYRQAVRDIRERSHKDG